MVDPATSRRWFYRMGYLGLMTGITFSLILPISMTPGGFPGPDLMVLFTFAWLLRRPSYVPVLFVAAIFLAADLLFLRPPGVWAALMVLGTEFLRKRATTVGELPFIAEWVLIAGVLLTMTLANSMLLTIFVVEGPGLGPTLLQALISIASYPLVVLASILIFGVRKLLGEDEIAEVRR